MEDLCYRLGYTFIICHCNFHLRGADSDRDEQFVRQLAQRHNVKCFVAQFDTETYAAQHKLSIEDAARQLRYAFFEEQRQRNGLDYIIVAHHRDDTIETFFINLLRGTGIAGLHGIQPLNGRIVRPMLAFGREDIDQYIELRHLSFVEDATNATLLYRRNQIRHQLLPLLRQMSPAFDTTMQRTMSYLSDVEQVYQERVEELRMRLLNVHADGIVDISIADINALSPRATLLFELLRPFGFRGTQTEQIIDGLNRGAGKCFLSPTHRLIVDRECVLIMPLASDEPVASFTLRQLPPPADRSFLREWTDATHAYFDSDRLKLPLSLRHWREGDRFHPFGMSGSRLLSDFFSDHKFSLIDKQRQLLLVDADDQILWIVGHRTDRRAAVNDSTLTMTEIIVDKDLIKASE